MKACPGCDRDLELSAFNRNSRRPDGLQRLCRTCHKLQTDAARKRRPQVSPSTKTCPRCAQDLPASSFARDVTTRDGLQTACRVCHAAVLAESKRRRTGTLTCPCCGATRQGDTRCGTTRLCPSCTSRSTLSTPIAQATSSTRTLVSGCCPECGAWWLVFVLSGTPADRFCSARCTRAAHARLRRARKRAGVVEDFGAFEIHERDNWTCHLCREPVDRTPWSAEWNPQAATLDHVVPLARGGHHTRANVATAHALCNSLKGDRL